MFEDVGSGMAYGLSGLAAGVTMGTQRMISDIGGLMPPMASPSLHPYLQARHGMYAHEMSFTGSVAGAMGMDIPRTTTSYEYQELAARDLGQRIGNAATMTGLYGGAAMASWHAGTAAVGAGWKYGKALGQASSLAARIGTGAAGIAGGVAGVAVGLAPLMALDMAVGDVSQNVRDRQDISNFLEASSFRYATGTGSDIDRFMGAGFNRDARNRIGQNMSNISMNDNFYSMQDLKGVLESGTELGLFSGARDAETFNKKFKELTDTLKTVTRTLHTSLEEGMRTIKELKDQGFTPGTNMQQAVMTADTLGISSGRTAAEMLTIGRQGSEMVRGTGIALSTGSTMLQQTTAMVDMMRASGAMTAEMVNQGGGTGAIGQSLMATSLNYMNSNMGRGFMMGMLGPGGQFDPTKFSQLASGDLSGMQIYDMATSSMSDPRNYIRSVANRNENARQMTSQFGQMGAMFGMMGGQITMAKEIAAASGVDVETAMRFNMVQQGISEPQIEASIGMLKNSDEFKKTQQAAMDVEAEKARAAIVQKVREEPFAITRAYRGAVDSVGGFFNNITSGISEGVQRATRAVSREADRVLFGVETVEFNQVTAESAEALADSGAIGKALDRFVQSRGRTGDEVFSKEEQAGFIKSQAFMDLESKFGGATVSETAMNARDMESYSKAVVGKGWANLSKEERMFVKEQADRTGMTKISEEIDSTQLKKSQEARQRGITTLKSASERRDEAKDEVTRARISTINEMAGNRGDVRAALVELSETGKGKDIVDEFIKIKGEIDAKGMSTPEDNARLLKAQQRLFGELNRQGASGRMAVKELSGKMSGMDLSRASQKLTAAAGKLTEAETDVQAMGAVQGAFDYLDSVKGDKLTDKEERQLLKEGVADVRAVMEGQDVDLGDLRKMSQLAVKSGDVALGQVLGRAATMKGEYEQREFLRTQGVAELVLGQKSRILKGTDGGILGNDDDQDTMKFQAETTKSLSDVQAQTAIVLEQLKVLANELKMAR